MGGILGQGTYPRASMIIVYSEGRVHGVARYEKSLSQMSIYINTKISINTSYSHIMKISMNNREHENVNDKQHENINQTSCS